MQTTTTDNSVKQVRVRWLLRLSSRHGVIFRDREQARAQLELMQRTAVPPGGDDLHLQPIEGRGRWCALALDTVLVRRAHRTREEAEQELRQTAGLQDALLLADSDEEADRVRDQYVAASSIFEAGLM